MSKQGGDRPDAAVTAALDPDHAPRLAGRCDRLPMYGRILVPLDGSETAAHGLREATRLAREAAAGLHLVHVVDEFEPAMDNASLTGFRETLDARRRRGSRILAEAYTASADAGVRADAALRMVSRASVASAIVDEALTSGCELIVMGTHGRRGASRLALGSRAEEVLRASPIPLLLVRDGRKDR